MKKQSKSEKIRVLLDLGWPVADIVKKTKATPAYVYNVKKKANGVVKSRNLEVELNITPQEKPTPTANDVQVGGDHYKMQSIQPWDAIESWGLGFLDGNVVKYVARHKLKGGVDDLKKARHYLDKLIEKHNGA